ncbi:MAG TPA: imidazole glycerol phosphate synthase subunit HisH [Geminicoccaceae bacterium]|nr:imidazole glycerol phosphate synthase subunit HisH [Geminicoccaceae bacterium]
MTAAADVVVVPTGVANLASVLAGLRRLGAVPEVALDAAAVLDAPRVMLPGVGAFGPAMAALRASGVDDALRGRIAADRPTMAICVGMQLLFEASDESPEAEGLAVIPGHVGRFGDGVRVPQFGWNEVRPEPGCRLLEPGYAYFANSYRALAAPGCAVATAEHGGRFVAALERGPLLACQFHPELSGAWGRRLLARWLEG